MVAAFTMKEMGIAWPRMQHMTMVVMVTSEMGEFECLKAMCTHADVALAHPTSVITFKGSGGSQLVEPSTLASTWLKSQPVAVTRLWLDRRNHESTAAAGPAVALLARRCARTRRTSVPSSVLAGVKALGACAKV